MCTDTEIPMLKVQKDEGKGKPLVLIHGLGNNHKSWDFVVKHLDRSKWRIITLDLLGFGDSPKPNLDYTPKNHADALLKTLKSIGIEKATLAGHSMGCNVALQLADDSPDFVEKLLLFGAPLYKEVNAKPTKRQKLKIENMYFSLFEIVKNNPDAVQAGGKIAEELVPFVKGLEITEETWPAYKKSLENTIMTDIGYKQALKLKIPTLFVCGLFDFFIVRSYIRDIVKSNKSTGLKNTLGPHEITPRQGRTVARIINKSA